MTDPAGTPAVPPLGSRVSIRYRLPPGSAKAFTDVVGHINEVTPDIVVRTKSGELITIEPGEVVSVRELSDVPVRASQIRGLEHAAALAWPGTAQQWIGGWFCRAGSGVTHRANSALPLDVSAQIADLGAVQGWYRDRGLPALLALPERLLPMRPGPGGSKPTRVMVRDVAGPTDVATDIQLSGTPDAHWLNTYQRQVPVEELAAVVDGVLTFASIPAMAVARGAVTAAPDGTRWLGISSLRVEDAHRRSGHAHALCQALVNWAAEQGAQRAYVQVEVDNAAAIALYAGLGYRLHHSGRYLHAEDLLSAPHRR